MTCSSFLSPFSSLFPVSSCLPSLSPVPYCLFPPLADHLQWAEGKSFFGFLFVQPIAQLLVNGADQGEEQGMEMFAGQVTGRNRRSGLEVENQTMGHGLG